MSLGPLALRDHFPATDHKAWANLLQERGTPVESLTWQVDDGVTAAPFYSLEQVPHGNAPLWHAAPWQIVGRVYGAAQAKQALQAGADALELPRAAFCPALPCHIPLHFDRGDAPLLSALHAAKGTGGTIGHEPPFGDKVLAQVAEVSQAACDTAWRTVQVDIRPYHEAGATLVQELALAASTTAWLLRRLPDWGVTVNAVARQLHFRVPVGTSYLPEVAKMRALRHITRQLLEAFGTAPVPLFVHAETSRRAHSGLDPATNAVRSCSQAMAAITGGANALTVPMDTLQHSCHLQLMLRFEAHLDAVADPGAGAYYVEALTDALGRAAWQMMQTFETQGGLQAIRADGTLGKALADAQAAQAGSVARGKRTLVGVNKYPAPEAGMHETPGDARPFEEIRMRTARLHAALGRRPRVLVHVQDAALRALAVRVMTVGGFSVVSDDHARAEAAAIEPGDTPACDELPPAVAVVSETPDGTALNIYPGCDFTRVLNAMLDLCHAG